MKLKFDVLHNFISPVTGRVLADPDYVLIGDITGIATPSPDLIDLRLDLINLRTDFTVATSASYVVGFSNTQLPNAQVLYNLTDGFLYNTAGIVSASSTIPITALPDLTYGKLWIGDENNRPSEILALPINNMAGLANNKIWIGSFLGRPFPSSTINQSNLPDIIPGGVWTGDITGRPTFITDYVEGTGIGPGNIATWFGAGSHTILDTGVNLPLLVAEIAALTASNLSLIAVIYGIPPVPLPGTPFPPPPLPPIGIYKSLVGVIADLVITNAALVALTATVSGMRLNNIGVNGDVSLTDYPTIGDPVSYRIIELSDPIEPQDAATKSYVDNVVGTATSIVLDGFVQGGPPIDGIIDTIRTPGDLDMDGDRAKNLQQDPVEDFDAVSMTFLWNLMHDEVNILWP